jgi:tRNA(Arg) A34 adenosine deaminase TadA
MREALVEAEQALLHGDVPVGAVAVREGGIVGRGHNRKEVDADPTAHAEMIALQEAARTLGGWRLVEVTLYCTLEPCPMCAGAMVSARLPRLVYGAPDRRRYWSDFSPSSGKKNSVSRKGAGVDDRGGLENRCSRKVTQGSNPCPSAKTLKVFQTLRVSLLQSLPAREPLPNPLCGCARCPPDPPSGSRR